MSLAFGSCTAMLEEDPAGSILQDDYLKNQDEVDRALFAIYGVLGTNGAYARYWQTVDLGTDDVATSSTTASDKIAFAYHSLNGDLEWFSTSGSWEAWWTGINYSNYIIYNVEDSPISDENKNLAIAEAMCMRAFFYFQLVRAWGDLPIIQWYVNDVTKEYTMSLPREKVEEVYKRVIFPDLEYASEYAPESHEELGRATKWLAKTLLADAYATYAGWRRDSESGEIYQGDQLYWQYARDMAEDVVKNSPYELMESYSEIWDLEFTNESILEVGALPQSGMGSYLTRECFSRTDGLYFWGSTLTATPLTYEDNDSTITDMEFYGAATVGWYIPTPDLLHAMEDGDERKWGILTRYDYSSTTTYLCQPAFRKYVDLDVAMGVLGTSYTYADVNFVVYRLVDAMLLYAEADNEVNGPQEEAINQINKIRNRAGLDDLTAEKIADKDSFREAIHQERRVELHGEVKRRFDLIRWNKFKSETANFDTEWLYTDNMMSDEQYELKVIAYAEANGYTEEVAASILDVDKTNKSYMTTSTLKIQNSPDDTEATDVAHLFPISSAEMLMYKHWYQNCGY